jgi:predicted metal-dependent peptidase
MTIHQRISEARMQMLLAVPFFGALAFRLGTEIDNSSANPTSCTDGKVIRFNEHYLATLTLAEVAGLIAEEVGHCCFQHLPRSKGKDHERWNQACDQVLWAMIRNMNQPRCTLSADCDIDERYVGMSAEEIYHMLPENPPNPRPRNGDFRPGKNDDPAHLEAEWKQAAAEVANSERMKGQGKLPDWLQTLIAAAQEPQVPWQETLRQFASQAARDNYSFSRPNKRYMASGFILPSLYSIRLGTIAVAIDTSGSICMQTLDAMLSELQAILDSAQPQSVHMITCNTRVQQAQEFLPGDSLRDFPIRAGGGTRFYPVFDHIDEQGITPACLIYLTDLDGQFPNQQPGYPCLWINYGDPRDKAPFGETIHVMKK